jgi:hypothetical protein
MVPLPQKKVRMLLICQLVDIHQRLRDDFILAGEKTGSNGAEHGSRMNLQQAGPIQRGEGVAENVVIVQDVKCEI